MASLAQIDANRRNSAKSTGPRTQAGKHRSSGNAHKHGFSIPIEVLCANDERLARSIAGEGADAGALAAARVIVEASIQLNNISKYRAEAMNVAITTCSGAPGHSEGGMRIDPEMIAAAITSIAPQLARLERY